MKQTRPTKVIKNFFPEKFYPKNGIVQAQQKSREVSQSSAWSHVEDQV